MIFRCVKLPEDNQQDDYDYYAIDIANKPEIINHVNRLSTLPDVFSQSVCKEFMYFLITFTEFPPCDPMTCKLRQLCISECPNFIAISQHCIIQALQDNSMIGEAVALYEAINCSDPATHSPINLSKFFDSQNCYTFSFLNRGKCISTIAFYKRPEIHQDTSAYIATRSLHTSYLPVIAKS